MRRPQFSPQLRARGRAVLEEVDRVFNLIKFAENGDADDATPMQDRLDLERAAGEFGLDLDVIKSMSDEQLNEVLRVLQGVTNQGDAADDYDEDSASYIAEGMAKPTKPMVSNQPPTNDQPPAFDEGDMDSQAYINQSYARGRSASVSSVPATVTRPFAEVKRPDLRNSTPEGDEDTAMRFALGLAKGDKKLARQFCEKAEEQKRFREQRLARHRSAGVPRAFGR